MTTKELIKQLKMIEKEHEGKEIKLQNIMESNYDGKTTVFLSLSE